MDSVGCRWVREKGRDKGHSRLCTKPGATPRIASELLQGRTHQVCGDAIAHAGQKYERADEYRDDSCPGTASAPAEPLAERAGGDGDRGHRSEEDRELADLAVFVESHVVGELYVRSVDTR